MLHVAHEFPITFNDYPRKLLTRLVPSTKILTFIRISHMDFVKSFRIDYSEFDETSKIIF